MAILVLTLRKLPTPDFTKLTPAQEHQFRALIDNVGNELGILNRIGFYSVHDATGKHVYDMHLMYEDGQIFEAGRKTRVGGFAQGGADCGDPDLDEALELALKRFGEQATATTSEKKRKP